MKIVDLLGGQAEYYLNHTCKTIDKQLIHIPGPDMIVWGVLLFYPLWQKKCAHF